MALFGKKGEDNSSENIEDLDAMILAAIEETDAEEEQRKADRKQAEIDRIAKQSAEREAKEKEERVSPKKYGRRFFMMPTNVEIGDNVLTVTGNLFGEVHLEDKVFVYRPNGQVVISSVLSIESAAEGQNVPEGGAPTAAKNAVIKMGLGFKFNNSGFEAEKIIPEYSVIANVQPPVASTKAVENPAILGMTLEYKNNINNKEFNRVLINHMVNSRFVLPVHKSDRIGSNGKPAMQLITVNDKDDESQRMLPIFTDVNALKGWKTIFDENNKPTVVIMTFQELVAATSKDGFDYVINAFGPVAVKIPFEFVSKMVASESYQKRFGENGTATLRYRKENVTDGAKIAVGAPPEIAEVKAVRDAIKAYCALVPAVKTAGLLCKINKGEKPGYLCIVDCPKEDARNIFMGIHTAVQPYLNKIKKIEFSRYEDTVFADQYFAQQPFDYVKNPNA